MGDAEMKALKEEIIREQLKLALLTELGTLRRMCEEAEREAHPGKRLRQEQQHGSAERKESDNFVSDFDSDYEPIVGKREDESPNAPKKPLPAFWAHHMELHGDIVNQCKDGGNAQIVVGEAWSDLSEKEKQFRQKKAEKESEEYKNVVEMHKLQHPEASIGGKPAQALEKEQASKKAGVEDDEL